MMRRALVLLRVLRTDTWREPMSGHSYGQVTPNDLCSGDEFNQLEMKQPVFRMEVFPKQKQHNYLASMYKWGYDSLTLFHGPNEDPGDWAVANTATHCSLWTGLGEFQHMVLWSWIPRYALTGRFNERPSFLRGNAYGRRGKNFSLKLDYEETLTQPPQLKIQQHTADHQKHQRLKNPPLKGFEEIDQLHAKRLFREHVYHIGNSLKRFMVDGTFGAHPGTQTQYRVFTDNATHAYFANMAAIRSPRNICHQEMPFRNRLGKEALEEYTWTRPEVIVYHNPGFDFEAPRIVEEFGGPRPQDFGLAYQKYTYIEPYSIPMRVCISADPKCQTILDWAAFLCGRWGFYADDSQFLTLPSDSILSRDGSELTVVVHNGEPFDELRCSPHLYGAHHHRFNETTISRCWNVNSIKHTDKDYGFPRELDFVEESYNTVHRPLPSLVGVDTQDVSHRFHKKRMVHGFKFPHSSITDPQERAALTGMLFSPPRKQGIPRPSALRMSHTTFVFILDNEPDAAIVTANNVTSVAESVASAMLDKSLLYADPAAIVPCMVTAFGAAKKIVTVGRNNAMNSVIAPLIEKTEL